MKHIYVSPHADDVALSCGAQILANPHRRSDSLVITAFTSEQDSSKPAPTNDQARFVGSIHADRDTEDAAAWDLAGVPLRALGLPEALLRGRFPFSISRTAADYQVMAELYSVITSYMQTYTGAKFYFPAGIGRHLDHLLCRDIGIDMLEKRASAKIVFYEDAPYWWLQFLRKANYRELGSRPVTNDTTHHSPQAGINLLQYLLQKNVPFPRGRKLFSAVYAGLLAGAGRRSAIGLKSFYPTVTTTRFDQDILAEKRQLVCQYKSQLPMLFGEAPGDLLKIYADCFATETTIELIQRPS